jgi:hypothetical protein
MRYLGALRGTGLLVGASGPLGTAEYELDAYLVRPGEVAASGEIRMKPDELSEAFGRRDLSLHTGDGRTLGLRFSGKRPSRTTGAAHADVTGGLPDAREWRR